jgi:hypothetical protein
MLDTLSGTQSVPGTFQRKNSIQSIFPMKQSISQTRHTNMHEVVFVTHQHRETTTIPLPIKGQLSILNPQRDGHTLKPADSVSKSRDFALLTPIPNFYGT